MNERWGITASRPILDALVRHGVRFIVIGGVAGNLHGSATITKDLDVCYARDLANLEALAIALQELQVTLRGADPELSSHRDARALKMGLNFTFMTEHGGFDALGEASGRFTYEVLEANAERMRVGSYDIQVASLDDLIRMKRAAGRAKDLIEVENLSALREMREEAAPYLAVTRARAIRRPATSSGARRLGRREAAPVQRRRRN